MLVDEAMPFYKLWIEIEKGYTSGDGYLDKLCMELVGLDSSRCRPPTRDVRELYRERCRQMMLATGVPGVVAGLMLGAVHEARPTTTMSAVAIRKVAAGTEIGELSRARRDPDGPQGGAAPDRRRHAQVLKFGVPIGRATRDIAAGRARPCPQHDQRLSGQRRRSFRAMRRDGTGLSARGRPQGHPQPCPGRLPRRVRPPCRPRHRHAVRGRTASS